METVLNTSIFYGLIGMFGWGAINFLVAILSKKIGSFRVAFLVQVSTFFPTLLLFPVFKEGIVFSQIFFLISIIGATGAIGYLSLTKGYEEGTVSVVYPLSSSWAVITALLSFIFLKERVVLTKIIGILLIFIGIALISADFKKIFKERVVRLLAGAKWGMLTAIIWGVNIFLTAFLSQKLGWYLVNLGTRFWTGLAFLGIAFLTRKNFSGLLEKVPKFFWGLVLLDVATFMSFNVGLVRGEPAIVSVVGSASPLISSFLAWVFLKEKSSALQKFGIFLCFSGIICLSFL